MDDPLKVQHRLRELVAEEVRALLARRRLNGAKLAQALGKSEMYVSRRLRGETAFDLDDLERIAALLDVDVNALMPQSARSGGDAGGGRLLAYRPDPDDPNSTYFQAPPKRTPAEQRKDVTFRASRTDDHTRPPTGPGARHGDRVTGPAARRPRVHARLAGPQS